MIARCRAKSWIIQLREETNNAMLPNVQRGMKGHIIVYPQQPSDLAKMLPPSLEDVVTPICVLFVGSSPPTAEWLRNSARPLVVRKEKVRAALVWLKRHNRHYKDIAINHTMLNSLEEEQILPVHVEHIVSSEADDVLTSRYDAYDALGSVPAAGRREAQSIPFQNVVISDVDGNAPSNQLKAAALRHIKRDGGGYVEIPHGSSPVNEFFNPSLFPMIYPTLYPYGLGGFEHPARTAKLSMKKHIPGALFVLIYDLQCAAAKGVPTAFKSEG
ncbi:hypothetical protein BV22DRAFT_1108556 [Leucogyrophana mollusca]|uniref:Uncharacterized protein n=1 Tax=Leucogyrophana mollusca TaxID=85980 RepID=A0ACB8AXA9_9AGAM|nr:hypothetical protein BV22DRAFT_1108556 [Leucogyrophana mollusca]